MSSHHAETLPGQPPAAHHWEPENAYSGAKLGMWLFLATEVLLFAVMFTAFAIYFVLYPEYFKHGAQNLKWWAGGINTLVLLFSSYLVAVAVDAAKHGNNAKVKKLLLGTIGCGGIFMMIKAYEYHQKYLHGLFPITDSQFGSVPLYWPAVIFAIVLLLAVGCLAFGLRGFHYERYGEFWKWFGAAAGLVAAYCIAAKLGAFSGIVEPAEAHYVWRGSELTNSYKMYYGLYYCMTGLHAFHVIVGMGALFWVYLLANDNRFSSAYYTPMELGGLYWHLVDLIWIFLFPLLYLVE